VVPYLGYRRHQGQNRRNPPIGHDLHGIPFPSASLIEAGCARELAE
jgi:hypothetical protein